MSLPAHDDLPARMKVAERRLDDHQREIALLRTRYHDEIQSLSSTVSHLTTAVGNLHKDVRQLRDDIPSIANTAAERAVQQMLDRREEIARTARNERRAGLSFRASLVFGGIGAAGTIAGLVALLQHFL